MYSAKALTRPTTTTYSEVCAVSEHLTPLLIASSPRRCACWPGRAFSPFSARLARCGNSGTLPCAESHINMILLACREARVKLCAGQSPRYRHVKNQVHRRRPSATRLPKATTPSASPVHPFPPLKVHSSVLWPSYLDGSCMCGQTGWAALPKLPEPITQLVRTTRTKTYLT
jgi:hypothetical protein